MDGLHVDGKLTTVIADDENTDAATTSLEGLGETGPKVGLIDDRQGLLDITSLGHGNNYGGLADEVVERVQRTYQFRLGDREHGIV